MVLKHLAGITTVVLVQQPTTVIPGMQHLWGHRTCKHMKKTFLGAPLRCLWTASLLTSFHSYTRHTLPWSVHRKLSTHITHSASTLHTSLVPAASAALGSHIFVWPRKREGKKASFSRWKNSVFFSKCNSLPPHVCTSHLPPTAASWN